MNDLTKLMSDVDIELLKGLKKELVDFIKEIDALGNMLSGDWRRSKELLNKISNDERKIDYFKIKIDKMTKQINALLGEK